MKKSKWILGLSIVGIMALSGTAFALTAGTSAVNTPQNQLVTSQPTAPSNPLESRQLEPSSQNTDSNGAITTPGSNEYNGGYGMMGGQGSSGYGMMGGQGSSGYGMMGGQGSNGYGNDGRSE